MRFINHLEAEIIELRAENTRLKLLLYGQPEEVPEKDKTETNLQPMGGFRPRHELATSIRLKIAREKRQAREKAAQGAQGA